MMEGASISLMGKKLKKEHSFCVPLHVRDSIRVFLFAKLKSCLFVIIHY